MRRRLALIVGVGLLVLPACNPWRQPPLVGGDDVAVDPVSGHCYRLVYLPATDRYPASVVTTDGVTCPAGVGNNR